MLVNVSTAAVEWAANAFGTTVEDFLEDGDLDDLELPPFNVSLDVDIESNPGASLQFTFEGLELFMQVRTMLASGSSFIVPLLGPSNLLMGAVDLGFGVFFTVDLIIDVERPLDMTSGIHLKLDDGVSFTIDLFGNETSDIVV